jgi:SAM-dependent methyltransferase
MDQPRIITKCRVCGNAKLLPIMSLGAQFINNFVRSPAEDGIRVPLEIVLCDASAGGCGLLQLRHTTPAELMYKQYWYKSGINESMIAALRDVTAKSKQLVPLKPGDLVVDIGANDGTMLRTYGAPGVKLVGFEPATNLIPEASVGTTKIINDFFSAAALEKAFPGEKAKIVTAIAMFYDLDDPNAFVADLKRVLAPDGMLVIQMSYLTLMLETNNFDNICHEHLEYYSMLSLENLLKRHRLEIFDVELNDVNGGSYRVYARHAGAPLRGFPGADQRIRELEERERRLGLHTPAAYHDFANRVQEEQRKLGDFVRAEVAKGKRVYIYGASTKGNTLLQYYGIGPDLVPKAADRNPDKWGRMTVGTHIPIVSEEEARKERPDYFLVLPWHFIDGFVKRERAYLEAGGKFIVPLPKFRVIGREDLAPDGSLKPAP